jgi:hypothetical protein
MNVKRFMKGSFEKEDRKRFKLKTVVIVKIINCLNLSAVFINTFLFNKAKLFSCKLA